MTFVWDQSIASDWRPILEPLAPTFAGISAHLEQEAQAGRAWLPEPSTVMRAYTTPLAEVRVLIVGQDPYPTPGDAVGLSFSVAPGHRLPPSLRNIARELHDDTGEFLHDGDLSHWAEQGVLLLNRVLTVRAGKGQAGSHRGIGWEQVTEATIAALGKRSGPLVAVLWGNDAQSLAPLLGDIPVVASAHPSPLSAHRGFFGSQPFSRVNAALQAQGAPPIRWGSGLL
ncbi:uracil-DNA glycosylase [Demequina sp. B12]|uniref:uracil-DNA glycosylase n=1 Tax=Demequina sp. B12 TaxID=2992757 RepID=UPI00237B44E5|nr:uracil-DNA glycosylase [Demequina sp. B12]MDE0573713.1 uracil-DNA glycosylase [Demequina sp. B12]